MASWQILQGDALSVLATMESESVQTCVTSPPYWGLRDYGIEGQSGLEKSPEEYVSNLVKVFREVKRVLRDDGTFWLNLGDSYVASGGNTKGASSDGAVGRSWSGLKTKSAAGLKIKDLVGIPWLTAFALRADGWYLRSDIIWSKPNPMPESVTDRPTKAHEYIFLFSKNPKYYYDTSAIAEPNRGINRPNFDGKRGTLPKGSYQGIDRCGNNGDTRNKRSVWTVTVKSYKGAHFATFPPDLIRPCVLAGAPVGELVLDPFCGAGTAGVVATEYGRRFLGIELNPEYVLLAQERIRQADSERLAVTAQGGLFEASA